MKLTIFGCCRQDSLYKFYNVSNIRDDLTYPHYSSEALQAMRFCAGDLDKKIITTNFIFRSLVISSKKINFKKIQSEFLQTDLFAIEIASRKYYRYKNFFLHHICEEPKYGCNFFDQVEVSDLTDQQIESDILSMKNLIGQKKFFLITHFYTRVTGKRYELAFALKRIGAKHGIPVFDPVEALGGIENIIPFLVDEPVYTHYNASGHNAIGELYRDFILLNFGVQSLWYKPYTTQMQTFFNSRHNNLRKSLKFFSSRFRVKKRL